VGPRAATLVREDSEAWRGVGGQFELTAEASRLPLGPKHGQARAY